MKAYVYLSNCAPHNGQHGVLEDGTQVYVFTRRDGLHVATARAARRDALGNQYAQAMAPAYLGCAPPRQGWGPLDRGDVVVLSEIEEMPAELIETTFAEADRLNRINLYPESSNA